MGQKPPVTLKPNCLMTRYPICFVHGLKNIFYFRNYWHGIPSYLSAHGYEVKEFFGPWRGPPEARLESFAQQFRVALTKSDKVHVIAHSLGTIDMLDLMSREEFKGKFASCTFVSPPFGGSPYADLGLLFGRLFSHTNDRLTSRLVPSILEKFLRPPGTLLGAIVSRPQKFKICKLLRIQHALLTAFLKWRGASSAENDGLVPLESQYRAQSMGKIFFEFPGDHNQVIGSGPWPKQEKTAHEMYLEHAISLAEYDLKTPK